MQETGMEKWPLGEPHDLLSIAEKVSFVRKSSQSLCEGERGREGGCSEDCLSRGL